MEPRRVPVRDIAILINGSSTMNIIRKHVVAIIKTVLDMEFLIISLKGLEDNTNIKGSVARPINVCDKLLRNTFVILS
jgi:hypothetical protein